MGWYDDATALEQQEVHTKEYELSEPVRNDVACSCVQFVRQYRPDVPEAETPQVHIEREFHTPKDHTILLSTPDAVYGSNCVSLVRVYRPDAPGVNAYEYPVSTTTPSVGAIGKIRYNNGVWHVFYVLEIGTDTLKIVDGNYDEGFVTVRVIPKSDPRIAGYS